MNALLRVAGRFVVGALMLACALLVGVQYYRVIERNVAFSHQLATAQRDVAALRALRDRQLRDIVRLSDPQGAIPEIHDRLHLVGKHEVLIYVQGDASPAP